MILIDFSVPSLIDDNLTLKRVHPDQFIIVGLFAKLFHFYLVLSFSWLVFTNHHIMTCVVVVVSNSPA